MTDHNRHRDTGEPLRRLSRSRVFAIALLAFLVVVSGVIGLTLIEPRADAVPAALPSGFDVKELPVPSTPTSQSTPSSPSAPSPTVEDGTPRSQTAAPGPVVDAESEGSIPATRAPDLPIRSGFLDATGTTDTSVPTRLRIPALGVDAPIDAVGISGTEMEIPRSADVVGWYEYGPTPGEDGSSVLAAHVDWGGRRGAFFSLDELPPLSIVEVEFSDGAVRRFETIRLTSYTKTDLPFDDVFRRTGDPILTLITCGGPFNPSIRRYENNVVAYAREITSPLR